MGETSRLRWYERLTTAILRQRKVPHHVAYIMDGNRRFAERTGCERVEGHSAGFSRLLKVLEWCLHLGVDTVTVFAFSLDNFKRDSSEVAALMQLAEQKFYEMLEKTALVQEYQIRINVYGELSTLPESLQVAMAKAMQATREHSRSTLNICFAYSSQFEVQQAAETAIRAVQSGELESSDISDELISSCLYSKRTRDPDVLIRTSGETRLSDFLLWQLSNSHISFIKTLWPDFSLWDLCSVILDYQRSYESLQNQRHESRSSSIRNRCDDRRDLESAQKERAEKFLRDQEVQYYSSLDRIVQSVEGNATQLHKH